MLYTRIVIATAAVSTYPFYLLNQHAAADSNSRNFSFARTRNSGSGQVNIRCRMTFDPLDNVKSSPTRFSLAGAALPNDVTAVSVFAPYLQFQVSLVSAGADGDHENVTITMLRSGAA